MERIIDVPAADLEAVRIDAPAALVTVTAVEDRARAELVAEGPAADVDGITSSLTAGEWTIALPEHTAAATGSTTIINGTVIGSVYRSGRSTVVNNVIGSGGNVVQVGGIGAGGRVIVNGVDVTDAVAAGGGAPGETGPVRLALRVPARTALDVHLSAGELTTRGELSAVDADTTSADVTVAGAQIAEVSTTSGHVVLGRVTGAAGVRSNSGDIRINRARGAVRATTNSGDVTVGADADIAVTGRSNSGDVTVRTNGFRVSTRLRSNSGDTVTL